MADLVGCFAYLYKVFSMLCNYYVYLCLYYYLTCGLMYPVPPASDCIVCFTRSIVLLVLDVREGVPLSVTISLDFLSKRYVLVAHYFVDILPFC